MKQFFTILLLSFLFLSGCQDDRLQLSNSNVQVSVSPSQLNLTSDIPSGKIALIANTSSGILWALNSKPDWVTVSPYSGKVDGTQITVTAQTSTLTPPQILNDKIVIITTNGKIEIPVKLTVTKAVGIVTTNAVELTPSPLLFSSTENSKQVTIKNKGNQPVNWQLESTAGYINITPASGTLNINQSVDLTITINRVGLAPTIISENLTLKLGGVKSSDISVAIDNYQEEKLILSGPVIDAEYDRIGDNLIVLIANKLYKLKPETKTEASVVLPLTGTSVSVSKNGQQAVVGHDAYISLVDLTTMTVVKTYPVSANVLDVILAPNNWAYVFPKVDQWQNIRSINLADGTEMLSTGRQIYAGTKAKLHPSGDYIYGANNGVSPSDVEKYDIRGGQATYLYDSPYHGDYPFSGDLWMADDGSRMFTRGRTVVRLNTIQSSDMLYSGTLTGSGNIQTLDHISSKNLVYAVFYDIYTQTARNEVSVFSGDYLNYLGTKPIPDFRVSTAGGFEAVPSEGVFGFFNSTGTRFFVCVKSKQVSNSPVQWAVATIKAD